MSYLLKNKGKETYFKKMTGIGPMSTPKKAEAFQFPTEEEALRSEASRHWISTWEVVHAD